MHRRHRSSLLPLSSGGCGAAIYTVDDEDEDGDEAADGEGSGALTRTESLASASAFWDALLRPHYLRLKHEEEARI